MLTTNEAGSELPHFLPLPLLIIESVYVRSQTRKRFHLVRSTLVPRRDREAAPKSHAPERLIIMNVVVAGECEGIRHQRALEIGITAPTTMQFDVGVRCVNDARRLAVASEVEVDQGARAIDDAVFRLPGIEYTLAGNLGARAVEINSNICVRTDDEDVSASKL